VRAQQSTLLGFLPRDAGDDGGEDKDDEGRLTKYFTSLFINASPHPIQDLLGNALYNSESDLVSSLRTLVYPPSPPRTPYIKITFLSALLLAIGPRIYTPCTTPSTSSTPSSPLHNQLNPNPLTPSSHYSAICLGHAHVLARKDVAFCGRQDEYVVSGSDDGNFFIWEARSAQIVNIAGSSGMVNVIVGHPRVPILATAGAAHQAGILGVEGGSTRWRGRMEDLDQILVRRRVISQGWGSYIPS